jgi:hypothetical protein
MEEVPMNVTLRPGNAEDAQHCGAICYEAFKTIAEQHNFPPDFPSPEVATELLAWLLAHPGVYAVVAALDGGSSAATSSTSVRPWLASVRSRSIPPCKIARSDAS